MKFYGALIFFMMLSAACGLRCYTCAGEPCDLTMTCQVTTDRCTSFELNGKIFKGCINHEACIDPIKCCDTDLCNSATPTGSSVLLLLVSSGIVTFFL
ncbi:lymphocyte antigen 6C2-like [Plectropomus leopardus]|uniref:lymphocyte antigen 6C2-like n=1 Tax=Plectropomus leopardus TaxID=160734 RepID=UPI001C4BDD94|nr:lymphocyte antigen 6C2-like [Plectropomus leopardus]